MPSSEYKIVLDAPRPTRWVRAKLMGKDEDSLLAIARFCIEKLPGTMLSGGVRPSDHQNPNDLYNHFAFLIFTFDLTPDGRAVPTQRAAGSAFKEGRQQ